MKKQRVIILCYALVLILGASAQSMGGARTRPSKIRLTHQLTRVEGKQFMGNGMADDAGWNLTFSFQNAPPICTKNSLRITIWREKDIFHPKNTTNTGVNWSVLEMMSFNVDPENPVNPKHYGYVINDPNVDEEEQQDCQLLFEWGKSGPFSVFLPDYLFMNMPLPDNTEHVANLPVKYYIAYEVDYGGTLFSSEFGTTPSVTYTMYVPEHVAHITDLGDEDLSGLFDEEEKVDSDSVCPPHRFFLAERARKGHVSTTPAPDGCTWEFDVYNVVEQCSICGLKKPHPEFVRVGSRCLEHELKAVSFQAKDSIDYQDSCTSTYLVKEVTYACQHDCCSYKDVVKDTVLLERYCPPPPPPSCTCPPHDWPEMAFSKIGESAETRTINGLTCVYFYNLMERPARRCQCCGAVQKAERRREFDHKVCSPLPTPKPCYHKWVHCSETLREGVLTSLKTEPIYDDDSLNITLNDTVQLKMARHRMHNTSNYISALPVTRRLWQTVYGNDDYLAYPKGDPGFVTEATYQEVYNFIGLLNDTIQQISNANVLLSLPSVAEMSEILKNVRAGDYGYQAQQMKGFFVDTVDVYSIENMPLNDSQLAQLPENSEVRLRVGWMSKDGKLQMIDISQCPDSTGFFVKAIPYQQVFNEKYGRYRTIEWFKCSKCGKVMFEATKRFIGRRLSRTLVTEQPSYPSNLLEFCDELIELNDADKIREKMEKAGFKFVESILDSKTLLGESLRYSEGSVHLEKKKKNILKELNVLMKKPDAKAVCLKLEGLGYQPAPREFENSDRWHWYYYAKGHCHVVVSEFKTDDGWSVQCCFTYN